MANIEGKTIDGTAYHGELRLLGVTACTDLLGYWTSDITSESMSSRSQHSANDPELNAHFGTPQDLLDLSTALHSRGMYLMVDVVSLLQSTLDL